MLATIEIWLNKQKETMSPLIAKLQRIGITDPHQLAALATQQRGCSYYQPATEGIKAPRISERQLSNEELAVALLSPHWSYDPINIRIGAQRLSSGCKIPKLIQLAQEETATEVLKHIAECGQEVEPDNPFWSKILNQLPSTPAAQTSRELPHRTRFSWETGVTNPFKPNQPKRGWLRPKEKEIGIER